MREWTGLIEAASQKTTPMSIYFGFCLGNEKKSVIVRRLNRGRMILLNGELHHACMLFELLPALLLQSNTGLIIRQEMKNHVKSGKGGLPMMVFEVCWGCISCALRQLCYAQALDHPHTQPKLPLTHLSLKQFYEDETFCTHPLFTMCSSKITKYSLPRLSQPHSSHSIHSPRINQPSNAPRHQGLHPSYQTRSINTSNMQCNTHYKPDRHMPLL